MQKDSLEKTPVREWIKKNRLFISVIVLVHVFYFGLACRFTRIYMGDSFEYIYEALNIKNLFFFYSGSPVLPITPEYMTQRQPLYPLFLLLVYLFTINNWIVIVLQNCISIFNICYARNIFSRIAKETSLAEDHRKRAMDVLFVIFTVAYPAQCINANTIAPDILLQTFAIVYFGNFISFVQKKRLSYAVWMSLSLIAGMLVKPVLYPFAPVHFLFVVVASHSMKIKMQRPALVAIVPVCAILLYNYWNFTRTGKFHFTSNQSFNALYYYYPFISSRVGADSAGRFLNNERNAYNDIPEYSERYDYANEKGIQLLKQNLFPYLLFHLKNSARIFIEPGKAEIDLFTGKLTYGRLYSKQQTGFFATWKLKGWKGINGYLHDNPSLLLVLIVFIFNCTRLVGMIRFFKDRNIQPMLRIFTFIFIVYFAVAAGPIANTRYFLPVSLIAIGCAAAGYSQKRPSSKTP